MLKLSKKHNVYEVWNEWAAESVFVDHKPSVEEIVELVKKNDWYRVTPDTQDEAGFIRKWIHVERLQHFYTTAPARVKKIKPDPKRCSYCNGDGMKSDDSYSTFECPWCGGTGKQNES